MENYSYIAKKTLENSLQVSKSTRTSHIPVYHSMSNANVTLPNDTACSKDYRCGRNSWKVDSGSL